MRHVSKIGMLLFAVTVVVAAIAVGCAGSPLRGEEASTSGIRAAQEAGAANVPQASLYLQLATEELELARKLLADGEKKQSTSMLMRAEADSELAVALSRGDAERLEAEKAKERVRLFRRDNS